MLNKLAVKAQLGWNKLMNKLREERGDAVTWAAIIIIGIIICVGVYNYYGKVGGGLGTAFQNMGNRAATGLDGVTVGP
ncbi:MAG: hypothetical protein ACM3UW_08345 [Bacillota bacterium]